METENLVTTTIKKHLVSKVAELKDLTAKRDALRDEELADIELEKKKVNDKRAEANTEYDKVKEDIRLDDENR